MFPLKLTIFFTIDTPLKNTVRSIGNVEYLVLASDLYFKKNAECDVTYCKVGIRSTSHLLTCLVYWYIYFLWTLAFESQYWMILVTPNKIGRVVHEVIFSKTKLFFGKISLSNMCLLIVTTVKLRVLTFFTN